MLRDRAAHWQKSNRKSHDKSHCKSRAEQAGRGRQKLPTESVDNYVRNSVSNPRQARYRGSPR